MIFGFLRGIYRLIHRPAVAGTGRTGYRLYPYTGPPILTDQEYVEKLRAAEYLVAVCTPTGDQKPSCWNSGWLYPPVRDDQCSVIPTIHEVFVVLGLPESDLGRVGLLSK